MKTATLTYNGVELVCSYEYEPAERRTETYPGSPEAAWLCEAKVKGVDIVDLMSKETIENIECQILEEAREEAEAARQDYWDNLRKERAMGLA
jgi:hypothetical protein